MVRLAALLLIGLCALGFCRANEEASIEDGSEWALADVYRGCGHFKTCYGVPAGCVEAKTCQQLIAYQATGKDGRIPIELYGTAPDTTFANNFWVGFGASASGVMADTAVVQCVHYSNGSNDVIAAYNSVKHQYNSLPDYRLGIHRVRHAFRHGFLRCGFHLDVERNVSGNNFDLKNPYSLLLGSGWVNETAANTYELKWHLQAPFISSQKIIFAFRPQDTAVAISQDIYGNCGKSRKCFGVPANCLASLNCASVLSYGATQDGESLSVDLYGTAPQLKYKNNFWIGFGLSEGGMMEKTAVLQCARFNNTSGDVVAAYNPPNSPAANNSYMPLTDKHLGITEIKTNFVDGYVRCSFNLNILRNVNGVLYDLSKPYFILLGSGWIDPNSGELEWHIEHPSVVASRQVLACGNQCQPEACLIGKCFGVPRTCQENGNCDLLLTWSNVADNADVIQVQLTGGPPNVTYADNFWIGFAVSPGTFGNRMSNAAVVQCVRYSNDTNTLVAAYNLPAIPPATRRYAFEILDDDHYGISQENVSLIDGQLSCNFLLDVKRTINGTLFDLTDQLYVMAGSGAIQTVNESTSSYLFRKHLKTPEVSSAKIALSCDTHCTEVYVECGISRKCFGVPDNCLASKTCTSLLSYGATEGSTSIPVDLYGIAPDVDYNSTFWIGFGLSEQGLMEKTAVIQCAQYANGSNDVVAAYNPVDHDYNTLPDKHLGIRDISTTFVDGFVRCSFNLDAKRNVNDAMYDLSKPYHVLLGSGWINSTTDELEWHLEKPATVANQQVLACGNQCQPPACATGHCFGVPRACEQDGGCEILVTWNVVPGNDDVVQVELTGGPPNVTFADNFWIGFAVTPGDVGNKMSNAAVVQCARYSNDTNVLVAAYNFPVTSPNTPQYDFEILDDDHYGISEGNISFTNGQLSCAFLLDVDRTIRGASFNLKKYLYVMAGSGWVMENVTAGTYRHRKHVHTPLVTDQRIALACVSNCTEPLPPPPPPSNNTGVFASPKGCIETNNCKMLVSYGINKTNNSRVAFTLSGVPDAGFNGLFWVAVALAPEQSMAFSYTMECVAWQDGANTKRDIFASYNDDKRDNFRVASEGLYLMKSSYAEGKLECQFESELVHVLSGDVVPAGKNKTFDLTQSQYLLLALGPLSSGNMKARHTTRAISSEPVVPASGGSSPPADIQVTLKKTHAILMVLAWNLLAAIGILMARHTKDMWPDRQPFGLKMWFVVHRVVMILTATLSIAGIVVVFVDVAEWRAIDHAYVGIVTFALAMVQPLLAFFRPGPGTPNRPYFNYFHWSVGYSTHLLSAVAMYLGTGLDAIASDQNSYLKSAGYIMIACFVENFLLQVALEIYKNSQKNNFQSLIQSNANLTPTENTDVLSKVTVTTEPLLPEDKVRQTILTANWLLITAGTVAIVALIIVA